MTRRLAAAGLLLGFVVLPGRAVAQEFDMTTVHVFVLLHDASLDELVGIPQVSALADAPTGGSGLLVNGQELLSEAEQLPTCGDAPSGSCIIDLGTSPEESSARAAFLSDAGARIASVTEVLDGVANQNAWVIVASVGASPEMKRSGDELNGIVLYMLGPSTPSTGPWSLSSSGTGRPGLVDGGALLSVDNGGVEFSGMSMSSTSADPVAIHDRYLAVRRMYVPMDAAAGTAVVLFAVSVLLVYFRRERASKRALAIARWICFATPALGLSLLAAGHLVHLNYLSAGLLVVGLTLVLPAAALTFRKDGLFTPTVVFAYLILAYFVVETMTGWNGTMFTLLGGTALDGARFYGLPNAFEGLLVGSAIYIAAAVKPWRGFAVIVAVALFMGLPWFGSDLGGAVVAFFAAGLWLALRIGGRFGWKEAALALATVALGMLVILASHRFLTDTPTHGTALIEAETQNPFHIFSVWWSRLAVGVRLLERSPVGLIYLAATPLVLWLVAKPRGGLKQAFDEYPVWRTAMLVLLWATVVSYFANDTGVSAVGFGFAMALGGTLYVPLSREPAKMTTS